MKTRIEKIKGLETVESITLNRRIATHAVREAVGQTYASAKGIPDEWFLATEVFSYRNGCGKHVHWSAVGQAVLSGMARGVDFADEYGIAL